MCNRASLGEEEREEMELERLQRVERRYNYAADNAILFIPGEPLAPCSRNEWNKFLDKKLAPK